jgi:hypothetical protein
LAVQVRMAATRSRTLRWVPRLSHLVVSSANKRSTRFSQLELGVKAMSLYNHVEDKDDVLDGPVELLWSEVTADTPTLGDWRSVMGHLAMSLRAVVRRHPHVAPLVMSRQLVPEPALEVCETYLEVMGGRGGVPEECAVAFLRTVYAYGFGYALAELPCLPGGPADEADCDDLARLRRVSGMVPAHVPDNLVRVALKV